MQTDADKTISENAEKSDTENAKKSDAENAKKSGAEKAEESGAEKADAEIDLRGLRCPLPVLRVKKALGELAAGEILRAFATDPGAAEDIPAFIGQTGHEMREVRPHQDGHYFVIVKK